MDVKLMLTPPTEAPTAIKAVVKFAQKAMAVNDVRITPGLNQAIWSRGIKSPPRRVRVRLERKRNDDEGAKEKLYVVASVVEGVTDFKVSKILHRESECPPSHLR
jgi:large subunit ribosomal protein L31e